LHDAVSVERAGTPAAAIMTDAFTSTARTMARSLGLPDYPFAVIPHPISSDSPANLRAKAADALRQCESILVRRRLIVAG
jgi:hypothetical protein